MSEDEDLGPKNKAERLQVAAAVAPSLRKQAESARKRRVAKVDKDGNVVGYTTLEEVQKALLLDHAIEIETQDGVRPKEVLCVKCGLPFTPHFRVLGVLCQNCKTPFCVDCGVKRKTNGGLNDTSERCHPCYLKKRKAEVPKPICKVCSCRLSMNAVYKSKHEGRCKKCSTNALMDKSCKRCAKSFRGKRREEYCLVCKDLVRKERGKKPHSKPDDLPKDTGLVVDNRDGLEVHDPVRLDDKSAET